MKDKYSIQSVIRAIDVLELFNVMDKEVSISELTEYTCTNKNYIFRLLLTLQSRQFVDVNPATGKYKLGLKIFELGQKALKKQKLINHTRPVLEYLKKQCHETTGYSIFKSDFTYYVDGVESDLTVRVVNRMGSRFPLHCTAVGKAQIAHLDEKELQLWIDTNKLSKFSTNTIINPDQLKDELGRIVSQGYAIEDQEFEAGVGGIAAPVLGRDNKIIGAIGISAPVYRLTRERLENELVPLIKWAGKELSSKC
ncbi:MAG: IclR family transcriptional regulator [Desulfuromonadaceae bacterium]